MSHPIVKIQNLLKTLDFNPVLKSVNATVNRGDIIALLGANGAGKTTLLQMMLGFGFPDIGSVTLFDGETATELSDESKQCIGYVPQQSDDLIETLTVARYLRIIAEFYDNWDQAFCERLLDDWQIQPNRLINKLSIGQKQKVSIIAAIAYSPSLLILDEPVASLDPMARRQFLQTIVELASEKGTTVVFSTHIVSDVERVADRLWIMKSGEIAVDEEIDDIKENAIKVCLKNELENTHNYQILSQYHDDDGFHYFLKGWPKEDGSNPGKETDLVYAEHLSLENIFLEVNRGI